MPRAAALLLLVASTAAAQQPKSPRPSLAVPPTPESPTAAPAGDASQSIMVTNEQPGLEFQVKLPGRSLRERDPRLQKLMDKLPDFGNRPRDWTDTVGDVIDNATKPRELGVLEEATKSRIGQMSSGGGDDDAWTWTPPSR